MGGTNLISHENLRNNLNERWIRMPLSQLVFLEWQAIRFEIAVYNGRQAVRGQSLNLWEVVDD